MIAAPVDEASYRADAAQVEQVYSQPLYVAPSKLMVTAFLSPSLHGAQIFAFNAPSYF